MYPVIKVENISKSYILHHQQREKYTTLRDTITNKFKGIYKRTPGKEDYPDKDVFWALKDISFEVNQGDRLGVIGRNGAGKSTLLKVLSRIVYPTSGTVSLRGRIASLLEVGTGFHPELTGRENIYLNGSILGMRRAEINAKFDEIVAFAEVERFLDTPVKRYSSGMYVRLAFAVAAHLEPEILIVDEVLAVGDMAFQKKCLGKMEDVASQGRTVLFVSHNMSAISSLCTKSILLDSGTVEGFGATEQMISLYLNAKSNKSGISVDDSPIEKNKKVKIRSVRILNQHMEANADLTNEAKGYIEVKFEVNIEGKGYDSSVFLSHIKYGPILTTCLKDSNLDNYENQHWKKGMYTYLIELPMDILRDGDYTVAVDAIIPKVEGLDNFKHTTNFYIVDRTSPVAKTGEGRNAAIIPLIKWKQVDS